MKVLLEYSKLDLINHGVLNIMNHYDRTMTKLCGKQNTSEVTRVTLFMSEKIQVNVKCVMTSRDINHGN